MPVKKEITRSKLKEVKKFLPQIHPLNDRVGKIETVKTPPPSGFAYEKVSEEAIEYVEYQFELVATLKYGLTYIFLGDIIDDAPVMPFELNLTNNSLNNAYGYLYYTDYAESVFIILGRKSLNTFLSQEKSFYPPDEKDIGLAERKRRNARLPKENLRFITEYNGMYCFEDPTKPLDFLEVVGVNSVGEKLILRGN